jgi:hypothetical protein
MAFITLETDDANGLMNLMVGYMVDNAGLTADGKAALKRWRQDRSAGTAEMAELTIAFNEALGNQLDERTTKLIKRKGRYVTTRGERG